MAPIKLLVWMMCVWGFRAMQLEPEDQQHPHDVHHARGVHHGIHRKRQHRYGMHHGMHHGTRKSRQREIDNEMDRAEYYFYYEWFYYYYYWNPPDKCDGENCWTICGKSYTSNLGGLGPDRGEEQAIRFSKVYKQDGVDIDLVITNTSLYEAGPVWKNRADCLGQINVKAGTNVWLNFGFVESNTNVSVPGNHMLSIMDVDSSWRGTVETVFFSNPYDAGVMDDELWTIRHADGGVYYSADEDYPWPFENPDLSTPPTSLAFYRDDSIFSAIEAEYRNVSNIVVNLNVSLPPGNKNRNRNFVYTTKMELRNIWESYPSWR